jgi:hypothetical protein
MPGLADRSHGGLLNHAVAEIRFIPHQFNRRIFDEPRPDAIDRMRWVA